MPYPLSHYQPFLSSENKKFTLWHHLCYLWCMGCAGRSPKTPLQCPFSLYMPKYYAGTS